MAVRKQTARKAAPAKKKAAQGKKAGKTAKSATRKAPAGKGRARKKGGAPAAPGLLGEVEALAKLMEKHGLIDVSYAVEPDGTKEIHVSRGGASANAQGAPAPAAAGPPADAPAADDAATSAQAADATDPSLHAFVSPMVGTFYRAPSPEAAPFVSVADRVDTASPVCIIEAMKVMNEITPDIAGDVVSIEVENGEAVEFGQTLMLIRPR